VAQIQFDEAADLVLEHQLDVFGLGVGEAAQARDVPDGLEEQAARGFDAGFGGERGPVRVRFGDVGHEGLEEEERGRRG
jgi:hypothetical protein